MLAEQQKSGRIFGRIILPRLEIGNELRCRESTEDAVVVIKVVDNYRVNKYVSRRSGS